MPFELRTVTMVNFVGDPDKTSRLRLTVQDPQHGKRGDIYLEPSLTHYPQEQPLKVDFKNTTYGPLIDAWTTLKQQHPDRDNLIIGVFYDTVGDLNFHHLYYQQMAAETVIHIPERQVIKVVPVTLEA